jgi:hypothetical protein
MQEMLTQAVPVHFFHFHVISHLTTMYIHMHVCTLAVCTYVM